MQTMLCKAQMYIFLYHFLCRILQSISLYVGMSSCWNTKSIIPVTPPTTTHYHPIVKILISIEIFNKLYVHTYGTKTETSGKCLIDCNYLLKYKYWLQRHEVSLVIFASPDCVINFSFCCRFVQKCVRCLAFCSTDNILYIRLMLYRN